MKKLLPVLCLSIFGKNIHAQTDSVYLKNEIGINLIPVFIALSNSDNYNSSKTSVYYKRGLKKNLFLRFEGQLMKNTGQLFRTSAVLITLRDTSNSQRDSVAYNYESDKNGRTWQLNAGLEYRWGKKRLRHFAGADIGFRYTHNTIHRYTAKRELYELINGNPQTTHTTSFDQINYTKSSDNLYSVTDQTRLGTVITPFYGIQFHFSRRFFFSAQAGLVLAFSKNINSNRDGNNTVTRKSAYSEFDLDASPLQNFSLCYRF